MDFFYAADRSAHRIQKRRTSSHKIVAVGHLLDFSYRNTIVQYFDAVYFLYGMIMTIVPMILGFLFAKYVLKLSLLNNLGSITGGMTSTPALGTLISTAGTENVASAYAATYPVALISVVLVSQFLIILFK